MAGISPLINYTLPKEILSLDFDLCIIGEGCLRGFLSAVGAAILGKVKSKPFIIWTNQQISNFVNVAGFTNQDAAIRIARESKRSLEEAP